MTDTIANGLIVGVVGAVAFIVVRAMVGGRIYGEASNYTWWEIQNNTNLTATAGETMIHDILPLAIAIMVVAGLFMGLTRLRGS